MLKSRNISHQETSESCVYRAWKVLPGTRGLKQGCCVLKRPSGYGGVRPCLGGGSIPGHLCIGDQVSKLCGPLPSHPPPALLLTPANTCFGGRERHLLFDRCRYKVNDTESAFKAKGKGILRKDLCWKKLICFRLPTSFHIVHLPVGSFVTSEERVVCYPIELFGSPWIVSPWLVVQATWGSGIYSGPQAPRCFEGSRRAEHKAI